MIWYIIHTIYYIIYYYIIILWYDLQAVKRKIQRKRLLSNNWDPTTCSSRWERKIRCSVVPVDREVREIRQKREIKIYRQSRTSPRCCLLPPSGLYGCRIPTKSPTPKNWIFTALALSQTGYYIQYNPTSILKSVYYTHNMHWSFDFHTPLSTEIKVMSRSKRFLSEFSPSVGRRLIKFQSSNQRNSLLNQICPVRLVQNPYSSQKCLFKSADSRKLSQVLSRQLPPMASESHCPVRRQWSNIYVPSAGRPPLFRPSWQLFHATTAIRTSSLTEAQFDCEHFNLSRCSPGLHHPRMRKTSALYLDGWTKTIGERFFPGNPVFATIFQSARPQATI